MEDDRRFHHGLLVIKDFTSVLSMHRDSRARVISALREVHDGYWVRDVGTDGGMRIPWQGRVVIVACCTSAWDSHREVVAQMGDRFVVVRNRIDRDQAGQQAVGNVGSEGEMRYQLREAVGGLLASPVRDIPAVADTSALLDIADLVTRCRTPVERDYQGNPIWAHALEAPTRFAKQLVGLARGGLSLGMSQEQAMAVAVRASADSMPPNYLAVLAQLAERGEGKPSQLAGWLAWPYQAARRACEELQLLGCVNLTFHDPDTPDRHKSYEVTAAGRAELVKVLAEYERPQ
jgi:DNA-binding MarR family transcriptional regulator